MLSTISILLWQALLLIGAGVFAAGAGPPSARPGSDTAWIRIGAPGVERVFVASPPGRSTAPVVVIVPERFEVDPAIREFARRLSLQGYEIVVPDLAGGSRGGSEPRGPARLPESEPGIEGLESTLAWLGAQPRTAQSRIAAIGFGRGAAHALELARRDERLAAVIAFDGPAPDDPRIAAARAPVQAHYGTAGTGIETATRPRRAEREADVYTYSGAGPGFVHEDRPEYRADASRQAWARMLAFLQRHLKG